MQRPCADVNSPCKRKCWTNSGGPLVNSLLWASTLPPPPPSTLQLAEPEMCTFPTSPLLFLLHRLNMEVDIQSLFGLYVTWCVQLYSLAETPQPPPIGTRITRALLVSKDRRHLFVTTCSSASVSGRCSHIQAAGGGGVEKQLRRQQNTWASSYVLRTAVCFQWHRVPLCRHYSDTVAHFKHEGISRYLVAST